MPSYKITRVSEQAPNAWPKDAPTTWYYKLMVEGHDRPISVGKKKSDFVFHVGDTIDGTITTDAGRDTDKFKADSKPFGGQSGGSKSNYTPPDTHAIAKSVALKAAVEYRNGTDRNTAADVLKDADTFLAWLEADDKKQTNEEPRYDNSEGF